GRVLVAEEVEAAHLVGAVVRAVARPDAAVVDHVVQAVGRVLRRPRRADDLARRVLALHARPRLEADPALLVAVLVDPEPEHEALPARLDRADRVDVVLRLAGDDAGVAADAGVEVDAHAPARPAARALLVERRLRLVGAVGRALREERG